MNSVMCWRLFVLMTVRARTVLQLAELKAKFHYASWFGDRSEHVRSQLRTASVIKFGREPASSC